MKSYTYPQYWLKVVIFGALCVSFGLFSSLDSRFFLRAPSYSAQGVNSWDYGLQLHQGEESEEPHVVLLEGKEVPLSIVDKYHVVLMYSELKSTPLCTIESLLRALVRGPSKHLNYASHVHVVPPSPQSSPAVVFVWMKDLDQQPELFDKLRRILSDGEGGRQVHLLQKQLVFKEVIANTPFEHFYMDGADNEFGKFREQNKGNALRLAIVQKYGKCHGRQVELGPINVIFGKVSHSTIQAGCILTQIC